MREITLMMERMMRVMSRNGLLENRDVMIVFWHRFSGDNAS